MKEDKKLKILAMPVDNGGCGNLRVRQPLEMIRKYTNHETHVADLKDDEPMQIYEAMKVADVIIVRQGGEQGMREIKVKYPEVKAKWVLDIDDNIEIISPYSEHYGDYGMEEFYDKNAKKWLWKDGVNIDILKNRLKVASLIKGMQEVDMVSVTTKKLASYASQYAKKVEILPNSLDLSKWWKLNTKPNKRLQVGWSGGISHYEDWYSIKEPLNQLMGEFDFDLIMAGANFSGVVDDKYKDRVKFLDWIAFPAHSYRMMCLALDIAIIPLADLPFNHYKSSIKFYEMGAMGVPSIVSDVLPYSEDIREGVNAKGYKSSKQFYNALKSLLVDPQERKKIGYGARKYVEKYHDARKNVNVWVEAYNNI